MEDYNIKFTTKIYDRFKYGTDEEKQDIVEQMILTSYFQMLRTTDVGLNHHIFKEIMKNEIYFKRIIFDIIGRSLESIKHTPAHLRLQYDINLPVFCELCENGGLNNI